MLSKIDIYEDKWSSLSLTSDQYEFPNAEMKLSFTKDFLHIKATVHDMHFKDGDRSWRYGDGFFINFVTKTYPDNKPSNKFYGYGFSIINGEQLTTLVNHNGKYSLAGAHNSDLNINIDEPNHVAYYDFKLNWSKLYPFHPLLHTTLGINIRYNSQNDDGSTTSLQQTKDPCFDSESVFEKHYIPMHFHQSKTSEFQFAFELESNLVLEDAAKLKLAVYSPKKKKYDLKIILKDTNENVIKELKKVVKLRTGINNLEELLVMDNSTASYMIDVSLDEITQANYEFYKLNLNTIDELNEKISKYEKTAKSEIALSSAYGLQFRIQELKRLIKGFDSNQSATPIRDSFVEIQKFLKVVDKEGHYFTDSGYYLAGFKSKDDQSIQPYSMILPKNFNIEQEYIMIVCLHGSGADEVWFLNFMERNFAEIGLPFILVGPRGRGLSDYYIGQTERDVFEIVEKMKSIFKISKSAIFGFSMGGYGVWRLTFLYPNSFDRAIIGSGMPYNNRTMDPAHDVRELRHNAKHIHYLVMHGTEDRAVPFGPTKEFMEILENEGFNVTFEVFEGAGHGNYDPSQSLLNWMQNHF